MVCSRKKKKSLEIFFSSERKTNFLIRSDNDEEWDKNFSKKGKIRDG